MADLTITAGNVLPSTNAEVSVETAGATLTAGQAVYKKASDSKVYLAQCDQADENDFYGITINGASAGQPVSVQRRGVITIGATVVVGTVYVLSATAGGICPISDLVATNYVTQIGIATAAGTLTLHPKTTEAQVPA